MESAADAPSRNAADAWELQFRLGFRDYWGLQMAARREAPFTTLLLAILAIMVSFGIPLFQAWLAFGPEAAVDPKMWRILLVHALPAAGFFLLLVLVGVPLLCSFRKAREFAMRIRNRRLEQKGPSGTMQWELSALGRPRLTRRLLVARIRTMRGSYLVVPLRAFPDRQAAQEFCHCLMQPETGDGSDLPEAA